MAENALDALVIGGGPAGLMAAEELARAGRRVLLTEAKSSLARKFLMAGKSGLNITNDQPFEPFLVAFDGPADLTPMLRDFGPEAVKGFCRALGQEVFTGSSGRVFPLAMKASPLLRAWATRLSQQGVALRTRWRWQGFDGTAFVFDTPEGRHVLQPRVTVLALGGASWSRLGSDGAWVPWLAARGVNIRPWRPANMGFSVDWSPHMARHFGLAVKSVRLTAGDTSLRGEFVISAKGLEGGGIYAVSRSLRDGAALVLDLMPDTDAQTLSTRLNLMKPSESTTNRLRKLGLSAPAAALVMEWGKGQALDKAIKCLPAHLTGPRPMDEAISVAGGIAWPAVTEDLQLRALPGVFVAGEMLDWEAPTGGYLLTACLATGRWAGQAAARV